jgi:peptide/nickel transport system ATP-binding protein
VGESGSGKTTAIRAALGLLPAGGRIVRNDILFEGRSLRNLSPSHWRRLRGREMSMIFQDAGAMLNPVRTIGSQFVEYVRAHASLSRREAWAQGGDMLERLHLPQGRTVMNSYPFQLSGGMRQRVGIAMAMFFRPKILLADEPTSALDVTIQAQIVREMKALRDDFGASILLVTHNLPLAAYLSDRLLVMRRGRVVDSGDRRKILEQPGSDYTRALLDSVPVMKGDRHD